MDDGQVLQKTAAQIELAVAGDLVGDHDHAGAGHGGDARIAAQSDGHTVVAIGDHGMGQHLFLGHSHLPPIEEDQATAQ